MSCTTPNLGLAETVGDLSACEKFVPLQDFILVDPQKRNQTAGGLAIPDGADPEPLRGKVIKCGPGRMTEFGAVIPMPVNPDDTIFLLAQQPPAELSFGNKKYLLFRARDLIGVQAE
jgi:chaperonin GroES